MFALFGDRIKTHNMEGKCEDMRKCILILYKALLFSNAVLAVQSLAALLPERFTAQDGV